MLRLLVIAAAVAVSESLAAHQAFERFLSSMDPKVALERGRLFEATATHFTLIRLLAGMYTKMTVEIIFSIERFLAVWTHEHFLRALRILFAANNWSTRTFGWLAITRWTRTRCLRLLRVGGRLTGRRSRC